MSQTELDIERILELAAGELIDETHRPAIRAALNDDASSIATIERALSLCEDPRAQALMTDKKMNEVLVEELVLVYGAHMTALGARATGGIRALTGQARRLLDAARRKDAIVRERLEALDDDARVELATRYLKTYPAPAFTDALAHDFPDAFARARAIFAEHTDPAAAFEAPELVAALRESRSDASLHGELAALLARLPDPKAVCAVALRGANHDHALVAASLLALMRDRDACDLVLARILNSSPDSGALCAISASLDPAKTRQALSLMLADSAWGNPEEPEHKMTPDRARALVAARSILPDVGSPAPPIRIEELGERLRAHRIDDVPGLVSAHVARWRSLSPN